VSLVLQAAIMRLIFWLSVPPKNVFSLKKRISLRTRAISLSEGTAFAVPVGYFVLKTRQP